MSRASRGKTSRWVAGRGRDAFWRDAKVAGYRSRAAYKLLAIDDAFGILKPGFCVVDLGCAPGGWAQVLAQRCLTKIPPATMTPPASLPKPNSHPPLASQAGGMDSPPLARRKGGMVVGVDLAAVDAIDGVAGVTFVRGDFLDAVVVGEVRQLISAGHHSAVDVVVSDMSPNLSGIAVRDQANAAALANAAMDFAATMLKPGGALVVKCFGGEEFDALRARARREYAKVAVFRPPATKTKSREAYIIGRGFGTFGGGRV